MGLLSEKRIKKENNISYVEYIKPMSLVNRVEKELNIEKKQKLEKSEKESICDQLDPINIFKLRLKNKPVKICENRKTRHICYINHDGYYNDIFYHTNGTICIMENIILDPSKSGQTEYIYNGPVDQETLGRPILSYGFFNTNCKYSYDTTNYGEIYINYFSSWNYEYENNDEKEKIEELAPGKVIFFISRNQDSPNLFHGSSEIINVISMMKLFNLKPENIQVVFLESMKINDDPFYDIYKNMISRGGKPIHVRNLKKKYHISSGIHVPINLDSPLFIKNEFPKCEKPAKTYKLLNSLIDKYMNIKNFTDSFISDNETFYYPKSVINNYKENISFNKFITIQWRKVWPKGRKNQQRLLGNGIELADKLASIVPKNILIRLVNTASLPIKEQISLIRKTDYLVGIHGAGLSLSIFMKEKSIVHELLNPNLNVLVLMSELSGHKTYSDFLRCQRKKDGEHEIIYFNTDDFTQSILNHMKENKYF